MKLFESIPAVCVKHCIALLGALALAIAPETRAINASGQWVEVPQPDGRIITIRALGDEFYHWYENVEGFAVLTASGSYVYAVENADGGLTPTALLVGRDNPRPAGIPKNVRPAAQFLRAERAKYLEPMRAKSPPSRIAPQGTVKNLVILCRFSDHTLGVHTRASEDYEKIMNSPGGDPVLAPSGSVRDYFLEASYGTMTLTSTVIAWVTLPRSEAYYANNQTGFGNYPQNAQGMVEDALNAADSLVNFGDFDTDNDGYVDAITIIHSGYAAETGGGGGNWIWSHRWSLFALPGGQWTSQDRNGANTLVKVFDYHTEAALWATSGNEIARIGVIAHETGHFFGLPDLYDTDGSSEGIGSYCLMANSWGFDFSQRKPPHLSAWAKMELGWVTPTNIAPGTHNLPRVSTLPWVYRITNGFPNREYLLIENRQPFGFESIMPQGGLAVWHIDELKQDNKDEGYPGQSGWPGNNKHYKVALLQADGAYHMERGINRGDGGDVFHGGRVSSIGPTTVPNTHRYQNGIVAPTFVQLGNISMSGSNMTFTFSLANVTNVPAITGFTPSVGRAGTNVIVSGTNLAGASAVRFNGVNALFAVESGTRIATIVPPGANTGPISVVTPNGTAVSASNFVVAVLLDNDHFADAAVLTGNAGAIAGVSAGATKEQGEPNHASNRGGASIWYRWTAPASGGTVINTEGSNFDTMLAVYTGSAVHALTLVAQDDDSGSGNLSALSFQAVAGTTYFIAVDGYNGAFGNVTLNWIGQPPTPMTNDHFADATSLVGAAGVVTGNNTAATREAGEPDHAANPGGHSVWYRWTAPSAGFVQFQTTGSSFDTLLAAYTGEAVNALSLVSSNNDNGPILQSLIAFNVTAGTTYHIAVDGHTGAAGEIALHWNLQATGPVIFNLSPASGGIGTLVTVTGTNLNGVSAVQFGGGISAGFTANSSTEVVATVPLGALSGTVGIVTTGGTAQSPAPFTVTGAPANDHFNSAESISGGAGVITGGNAGATKEPGEPSHAGNQGGRSVWYRWTAPGSGPATFMTLGSSLDTVVGIYTGASVNALTPIASGDDTSSNAQSVVTFNAIGGTTYHIAVDGYNFGAGAAIGSIVLRWSSKPDNDAFAAARLLTGYTVMTAGSTFGATKEAGEPNHAGNPGGKSIWYRWTAPTNGPVVINTAGSSFDTLLAVYTGSSVGALVPVAADNDSIGLQSQVQFDAVAGTVYRIAVDGWSGSEGIVSLNLFVRPKLQVQRGSNSVVLVWPTTFGGYSVQGASALQPPDWANLSNQPVSASGLFRLTNSTPDGTHQLFRLTR